MLLWFDFYNHISDQEMQSSFESLPTVDMHKRWLRCFTIKLLFFNPARWEWFAEKKMKWAITTWTMSTQRDAVWCTGVPNNVTLFRLNVSLKKQKAKTLTTKKSGWTYKCSLLTFHPSDHCVSKFPNAQPAVVAAVHTYVPWAAIPGCSSQSLRKKKIIKILMEAF